MTDAVAQRQSAAPLVPDPKQMMRLPDMTRVDVENLKQCADLVRRNCPIEQVPTIMALIEKLASATPVPSDAELMKLAKDTGAVARIATNRHGRRGKGAKT